MSLWFHLTSLFPSNFEVQSIPGGGKFSFANHDLNHDSRLSAIVSNIRARDDAITSSAGLPDTPLNFSSEKLPINPLLNLEKWVDQAEVATSELSEHRIAPIIQRIARSLEVWSPVHRIEFFSSFFGDLRASRLLRD
jgi:hypothetical protein